MIAMKIKLLVLFGLHCMLTTSLAKPHGLIERLVDPLDILRPHEPRGSDASAQSQATSITGGIHLGPLSITASLNNAEANSNARSHGNGFVGPIPGAAADAQANSYNGFGGSHANADAQANNYNGFAGSHANANAQAQANNYSGFGGSHANANAEAQANNYNGFGGSQGHHYPEPSFRQGYDSYDDY